MEGTFVDLGTWRKSENKIAWYGYRSKYSKIYGRDTQRRRVMKRKGLDFGILCCHRTGSSRLFSRTQATMDGEIFAISFVLISYFFHFYFCNKHAGGESQPCRKTCRFKWFTRDIKRRNNAHDRKSHGHHIF